MYSITVCACTFESPALDPVTFSLSSAINGRHRCSQAGYGAVISNEPGGDPTTDGLVITDSSFTGNEGGGVAAFNSDLEISGTDFTGNTGTATYVETSNTTRGFNVEVRRGGWFCCDGKCFVSSIHKYPSLVKLTENS